MVLFWRYASCPGSVLRRQRGEKGTESKLHKLVVPECSGSEPARTRHESHPAKWLLYLRFGRSEPNIGNIIPEEPHIGPGLRPSFLFFQKMALGPENIIPPPISGPNLVHIFNQTYPPITGGPDGSH